MFLGLCYVGTLSGKMILSSGMAILAWGIVEKQTGVNILWSQWLLAFLPLIPLTILASWLTMRWLYPPETPSQPLDHRSSQAVADVLGPWSWNERKVLGWLLLAITLWITDFWHHINPAAVAIAIGMILTWPGLGVLDMKAVKSVNFLIIVFVGGVLSMANVLTTTHALTPLTDILGTWHEALLSNAWRGTLSLYWGGFLYHFLMASEFTMVSTVLPVLLKVSTLHGYNPAAVGMLWLFAGSGKLFIYQNTALVFAYSFGFFQPKDLLKVGAVLTVVEGFFILPLVTLYWPLIAIPWRRGAAHGGSDWAGGPFVLPPCGGQPACRRCAPDIDSTPPTPLHAPRPVGLARHGARLVPVELGRAQSTGRAPASGHIMGHGRTCRPAARASARFPLALQG